MTPAKPSTPPAVQPVPPTSSTCWSAASTATRTRSSGPHPHDGGVTVRALKPLAQPVVGPARRRHRATRSSHEHEGIWVGVLPGADVPDYRLEVAYDDGHAHTRRRPLPVPADARRDGPAPDQRGPARAAVGGARRPGAPLRHAARRHDHRHLVRGLGAVGPRRPAQGRLQQLGRPRAPDAPARAVRRLGAVRARASAPAPATSTSCSAPTAQWREKADPMASYAEPPAGHGLEGLRVDLRVGRRRLDGRPARPSSTSHEPMSVYEMHLGVVAAAGKTWQRARRRAAGVPRRPRLHPRRADAGDAAPVRRLVGLPRDVVLRAGLALRRPRRLPAARRPAAPGRHRRDPRLGARATSPPTSGRWPASTARRSTRTPTRSAAGTRSGAPTSSTSAATRCATSSTPTRSTGSRSSTPTGCGSTASRRCSTSTTPARRASGRRTSTAAARTSRRCSSSRR